MKSIPIILVGAFATLNLDAPTPAQESRGTRRVVPAERSGPTFEAAGVLIGSWVVLEDERTRGSASVENARASPGQKVVGVLRDILVDARTGRLLLLGVEAPYLVDIEPNDSVHAVPADRARWDAEKLRWIVTMSESEFGDVPIAENRDLTRLKGPDGDPSGTEAGRDSNGEVNSDEGHGLRVTIGRIQETPVTGYDGEVASSSDVVVETRSGTLAFLSIDLRDGPAVVRGNSARERAIAIPFPALEIAMEPIGDGDDIPDSQLRVRLLASRSALEDAPATAGVKALRDPTVRQGLYNAFGVDHPNYEPADDKSTRDDDH